MQTHSRVHLVAPGRSGTTLRCVLHVPRRSAHLAAAHLDDVLEAAAQTMRIPRGVLAESFYAVAKLHGVCSCPGERVIASEHGLAGLLASAQAPLPCCAVLELRVRGLGGKGGFGAMIRQAARGGAAKKTTNFSACRTLDGRRLRNLEVEKKLEEWHANGGKPPAESKKNLDWKERKLLRKEAAAAEAAAAQAAASQAARVDLNRLHETSQSLQASVADAVRSALREARDAPPPSSAAAVAAAPAPAPAAAGAKRALPEDDGDGDGDADRTPTPAQGPAKKRRLLGGYGVPSGSASDSD